MLGGVYVRKSREAADKGHEADWRANVARRTGAQPVIACHDLLMLLGNEAGTVSKWPE